MHKIKPFTNQTIKPNCHLHKNIENIYNQINVSQLAVFSLQMAGAFLKSENQTLISSQFMEDD